MAGLHYSARKHPANSPSPCDQEAGDGSVGLQQPGLGDEGQVAVVILDNEQLTGTDAVGRQNHQDAYLGCIQCSDSASLQ